MSDQSFLTCKTVTESQFSMAESVLTQSFLAGTKIKCKIQYKGDKKDGETQEGEVFKLIRFPMTD